METYKEWLEFKIKTEQSNLKVHQIMQSDESIVTQVRTSLATYEECLNKFDSLSN